MKKTKFIEALFWSRVKVGRPTQCWPWKASVRSTGYGQMLVGRDPKSGKFKNRTASIMAYEFAYGEIEKGLFVCHHCDNPPCCNPYHLFLGTQKDNMIDCAIKQRNFRKLTESDVRTIRANVASLSKKVLAARFNVCVNTIKCIWNRTNWDHLK